MCRAEAWQPLCCELLCNPACVQPLRLSEFHMGISLSSAARLVEAVPSFIEWLWPHAVTPKQKARGPRAATGAHSRGRSVRSLPSSKQFASHAAPQVPNGAIGSMAPIAAMAAMAAMAPVTLSQRPLRVLRVFDGQPTGTGSGRMVISGRMADVCAELDRLAEVEAAYLAATRQ